MDSVIDFQDRHVHPAEEDIDTQLKRAALRLREVEVDRLEWELRQAKRTAMWRTVRRTLFWGALAWLASHMAGAQAQQTTFRDADGRTIGTATRDSQGTTTFRDARGRTTGTATLDGTRTGL